MEFEKLALASEIPPGSMRRVQRNGTALLIANVDGAFYAISDVCSHRGGMLSAGTTEDGIVTCPRHGSRFDVRTGRNVGGPGLRFFKWTTSDVRSYEVTLDGNDILLRVE